MSQTKQKRGRPRKVRPVFADPVSERLRVERCQSDGRDPYPPFKHVPCEAERELRKGIVPGVPFDLVLRLNDTDLDGRPLDNPEAENDWDGAQANRDLAARSGAEARPKISLAATIIAENMDYIQARMAMGAKISEIFASLNSRRLKSGSKPVGRSEFYKQLRVSGLFD